MLEVTEYRLKTFLFLFLVFSPSWMLSFRNDGCSQLGQFQGNKAFIGLCLRQHRKQKARTRHQFKDLFSDIIKSYCTVVFLSTISIIFFFYSFYHFLFRSFFSLFLFEIVLFYIIHQAIFSLVVSLEEKAATNTHNSWIMINIFFFRHFSFLFLKYIYALLSKQVFFVFLE